MLDENTFQKLLAAEKLLKFNWNFFWQLTEGKEGEEKIRIVLFYI